MFGTLIESRAITPRRTGGSVASIIFHSLAITGGVVATTQEATLVPPEPPIVVVTHYVRRLDPTPVASQPTTTSAPVGPAPFVQRIVMPSIIPVGIPPMDPSAVAAPITFGDAPISSQRLFCERDCASPVRTDGDGRQLWDSRDLMMRLLNEPVPPRYPESLRRAGVEGDVVVQFVVDTTGRIDMGTIEVLRSTHAAFTAAVRETLAQLRFAPAIGGEQKVRALAVMPFHFTLR